MKRCVLYARLSVSKEESVSIARQLDSCRRYAEGRGWEVIGEFVDDGVSATANRPGDRKGWRALLGAGGFEAVVIWKVDRLARRVLDFLQVDEALQKRGAGLVAVEDPIDMTTPMGRAFATILAVFGEMEAAAIASRVRAAREHIVKAGRWPGGGYPYGYHPIDNPVGPGKVLTHDPDRIEWLHQMVARAQRGDAISAITTWLTQSGAPLPGQSLKTSRVGAGWNRQAVAGILRNPTLAGATIRTPGRKKTATRFDVLRDAEGDPVINPDLAIMTLAEWDELQAILDRRGTPQSKPFSERQRTSELLSRVATCAECDMLMMRGTNQQKPTLYCRNCRQTITRVWLDPYITRRLLAERGREPYREATVKKAWDYAEGDDAARRDILASQIETFHIRRGKVGAWDKGRVLLVWRPSAEQVAA